MGFWWATANELPADEESLRKWLLNDLEMAMEPESWKARLRDPFPKWTPQLAEHELAHSL